MTENQEPRNDAVTPRTLVIIPTYNEALNITNQVTGVRENAPEVDILVVDDGSPDGTGAIVDSLAAADDHIHVMHRTEKGG
ncbi:MAG: glycosyltransferase, partial [Cellulomonadaceae bacterium]|nr:glycosyltransferase [Cellulomonadaceae bacterium]